MFNILGEDCIDHGEPSARPYSSRLLDDIERCSLFCVVPAASQITKY